MTEAEAYRSLTGIFHELLADDAIALTPGTTAQDVEGWDSFTHMQLIVAIETRCGFRFTTQEIEQLRSVADLIAIMMDRTAQLG